MGGPGLSQKVFLDDTRARGGRCCRIIVVIAIRVDRRARGSGHELEDDIHRWFDAPMKRNASHRNFADYQAFRGRKNVASENFIDLFT